MKKSIKRMLTTALAIAMMVTMIAIPVSAYPTDTKTFVLMNDDMSSAINRYHDDKTEANASWANFYAGKQWSQPWDNTPASFAVDNGDVAFYANAATRTNDQAIKGVFRAAPVVGDAKVSSVTMTYDVKTGSRTTNPVDIYTTIDTGAGDYRYVHDSNDDIISRYNSSTGQFFHGGWHNYNVTLSENTEYKIEYKFNYDGGKKNHMLSIVITDKAGNTSITKGEEQVETATLDEWDFYKKDIKTLTAIGYMLSCTAAAEADAGKEVFRIQNIKIENTVKGDVINFGDVAYNGDMVMMNHTNGIPVVSVVETNSDSYLAGSEWGASDVNNALNHFVSSIDGYLWGKTPQDGVSDTLNFKFEPIEAGENLKVSATVFIDSEKATAGDGNTAESKSQTGALRLLGDDTDLTLIGHHTVADNKSRTNVLLKDYAYSLYGLKDGDVVIEDIKKIDESVVTTGWTRYHSSRPVVNHTTTENTMNSLIDEDWDGPNTNDWNVLDGDLAIEFAAVPNTDGENYDITMTIKGTKCELTSIRKMTVSEMTDLDTICISLNGTTDALRNFFGIKSLKVEKSLGNPYPVVGENIAKIPYTNLSGAGFDADVFVVERDAETGKLVKATIVNKKDITAESGELECTFEVKETGSKLDFYILNDADSMILLSGKTTFEVGE